MVDAFDRKLISVTGWRRLPWKAPVMPSKEWCENIRVLMPALARMLIQKQLNNVATLAAGVEQATPKYTHIFDTDHVNHKLAKKHLLKWPSRDQLNRGALALFRCLAEVSRLHTQWNLQPPMTEDEDYKQDVASATKVFDAANSAIRTIAALSVIHDTPEDKKAESASKLPLKSASLPQALARELEGLVTT